MFTADHARYIAQATRAQSQESVVAEHVRSATYMVTMRAAAGKTTAEDFVSYSQFFEDEEDVDDYVAAAARALATAESVAEVMREQGFDTDVRDNDGFGRVDVHITMYVTLQHTYACECSTTDVIAVCNKSHLCVLAILRAIFSNLTFNYYDPKKRWYQREEDWIDGWSGGTGVSDYRVEKWVDNERLMTYHYDFDTFLKRKIFDSARRRARYDITAHRMNGEAVDDSRLLWGLSQSPKEVLVHLQNHRQISRNKLRKCLQMLTKRRAEVIKTWADSDVDALKYIGEPRWHGGWRRNRAPVVPKRVRKRKTKSPNVHLRNILQLCSAAALRSMEE
ncbi:hypothetical protein JKP88DRAFT_261036 [Tribonema minus]|uniref:Uncharacterized protein n=1 Tax=Tribonema minus TaxID=303371 RepID=A0A836CGG4_9STRA|nr:hypothetical protein JKP88DRAFT_261036 [Tribonema minus]